MDGRVLTELLAPAAPLPVQAPAMATAQTIGNGPHSAAVDETYTDEEDAAIQQRLADLGYL